MLKTVKSKTETATYIKVPNIDLVAGMYLQFTPIYSGKYSSSSVANYNFNGKI